MSELLDDYTSLSTLAACAMKYHLAYSERLEAPEDAPMRGGSAIHEALDEYYRSRDSALALEALEASWSGFVAPLGSKHGYMTLGHLKGVLTSYIADREAKPTLLEQAEVMEHAESVLRAEVASGVCVGGKPDLPISINGKHYIVDHKATTIWLSDWWLSQFQIGHQLRVYALMMQALTGIKFDGGFINAIYIGKGADADEATWAKRKSVPNKLHAIRWTPSALAETVEWIKAHQASAKLFEELGHWPQNEKACGLYGGCEFLDICKAPQVMRAGVASTHFQRWEPKGILRSGADGKRSA